MLKMEIKLSLTVLFLLAIGSNAKKLPLEESRPYIMNLNLEIQEDKITDFVVDSLFATLGWKDSSLYCHLLLSDVLSVIPFKKTSVESLNTAISNFHFNDSDEEINNFIQNLDYTLLSYMGLNVGNMYKNFVKTYLPTDPTKMWDILNVLGIGQKFAVAYAFGSEADMFLALKQGNFSLAALSEIETLLNVTFNLKDLGKVLGIKKFNPVYLQMFVDEILTSFLSSKNIQQSDFVNFLNSFMLESDDFEEIKGFKLCYQEITKNVALGVAISRNGIVTNDDKLFETYSQLKDFTTLKITSAQTKTSYPFSSIATYDNMYMVTVDAILPQYLKITDSYEGVETKMCTYITTGLKKLTEQPVRPYMVENELMVTKTFTTTFRTGSPLICEGILYGLASSENLFRITFDVFEETQLFDEINNQELIHAISNLFDEFGINPCNYFNCIPSDSNNAGFVVIPPVEGNYNEIVNSQEMLEEEEDEGESQEGYEYQEELENQELENQELENQELENQELENQEEHGNQEVPENQEHGNQEILENQEHGNQENQKEFGNQEGKEHSVQEEAQPIKENQIVEEQQVVEEEQIPVGEQIVEGEQIPGEQVIAGQEIVEREQPGKEEVVEGQQVVQEQQNVEEQQKVEEEQIPEVQQVIPEQEIIETEQPNEVQVVEEEQPVAENQIVEEELIPQGEEVVAEGEAIVGEQPIEEQVGEEQIVEENQIVEEQVVKENQIVEEPQLVQEEKTPEGEQVAGGEQPVEGEQPIQEQVVEGEQQIQEQVVEGEQQVEEQVVQEEQAVEEQNVAEPENVLNHGGNVQEVQEQVVEGEQQAQEQVVEGEQPIEEQVVQEEQVVEEQNVVQPENVLNHGENVQNEEPCTEGATINNENGENINNNEENINNNEEVVNEEDIIQEAAVDIQTEKGVIEDQVVEKEYQGHQGQPGHQAQNAAEKN